MWIFSSATVSFEQAVYGSFAFWDRGYDILAQSPNCQPDWLGALRTTSQHLGERSRDAAPPGGVFSRWLDEGSWMVVRPSPQGVDDRGRPDAVAFHAIFLTFGMARRAGFDPFRLSTAFREDWGPSTTSLPSGQLRLGPGHPPDPAEDQRAGPIAEALWRGNRVLIEASGPIDSLAAQVWARLPNRIRVRRSMASWAYADSGEFDLIALPRLIGIDPMDRGVLVVPRGTTGTETSRAWSSRPESVTS